MPYPMQMSLDFDSIRQGLRGAIRLVSAGTIGVVLVVLVRAGNAGGERKEFDPKALSRWFASLTAQEFQRLLWCLSLDAAGAAPELLMNRPLGETVDLLWAPIYAFLLFQTFGDKPILYKCTLAMSGFLEEALPYISFVPSATIGWLLQASARQALTESDATGGRPDKDET